METVKDLKNYLLEIIANLEEYNEETELSIVENTYWLKGGQNFIAIEGQGFIDLDNPTDLEECAWCEDKFDKTELIKTREFGCLCEQCFSYLESVGEKLTEED